LLFFAIIYFGANIMKKLLIICFGLTACTLLMIWWLYGNQADFYTPVQAEEPVIEPALDAAAELAPSFAAKGPPQDEVIPGPGWESEPNQWETTPLLALTFDDGPSKDNTPVLLDGLRERGVHVTFFMLGMLAAAEPEIVLRAYKEGHAIGGHSFDHRSYFTKLSADLLKTQLQKTDDIIAGITGGAPPFLLRPPYGRINEEVAQKTGKANILWSADPRDWEVRDAELVCAAILECAVDGGVVILHDIHETSVDGALQAIDELLAGGWQFVTIPELYAAYGITLQAGGIYHSPDWDAQN
jgi:peptidoglycan/xylan/chitin deacetylase (PgdA/CDA1 family)